MERKVQPSLPRRRADLPEELQRGPVSCSAPQKERGGPRRQEQRECIGRAGAQGARPEAALGKRSRRVSPGTQARGGPFRGSVRSSGRVPSVGPLGPEGSGARGRGSLLLRTRRPQRCQQDGRIRGPHLVPPQRHHLTVTAMYSPKRLRELGSQPGSRRTPGQHRTGTAALG